MSNMVNETGGTPKNLPLRKADCPANPFDLFTTWFSAALASDVIEPNAMMLATTSLAGRPAVRTVLLRGFDVEGFCFYTNYESRKGQELAAHPWAALVFWWGKLERQVRIEGKVEKLKPEASDTYFNHRPLGSRFSAIVSAQSQVIPSRAYLEARLQALESQYGDQAPPRPPFWGGYRVIPDVIEFWQSGPNRLHDRLRYTQEEAGAWTLERLSP